GASRAGRRSPHVSGPGAVQRSLCRPGNTGSAYRCSGILEPFPRFFPDRRKPGEKKMESAFLYTGTVSGKRKKLLSVDNRRGRSDRSHEKPIGGAWGASEYRDHFYGG